MNDLPFGLLARNRRAEQRANRTKQMQRWQLIHSRQERITFNANVRFFRQVEKNVVRRFEDSRGNASIEDLFRGESWRDEFNSFMLPLWNQTIWTGVKFEADYIEAAFGDGEDSERQRLDPEAERILLEGDPPPSIYVEPDEVTKARIRTWLRGRAVGVWNRIGETTKARIRRSINKGIRDGLKFNEMADLLRADLAGYTRAQARRVARTETTGAINNGQYLERKELGIEKKIWIMRQDVKVRQPPKSEFNHWKAHRQVQLNDEPFIVSNEPLMFPGDSRGSAGNVINCRCSGLSHFDDKPTRRKARPVAPINAGTPQSRLIPKGPVNRNVPIEDRIKNEAALRELREQITANYKSLNAEANKAKRKAIDDYYEANKKAIRLTVDKADPEDILAARNERNAAIDRYVEIKKQAAAADELSYQQSQKMFSEIAVPQNRRGSLNIDLTNIKNKTTVRKANESVDFLEKIVDRSNLPEDHVMNFKQLRKNQRAYATGRKQSSRVHLTIHDDLGTYAHEMAHTIEMRSPGVLDSCEEFIRYRIKKAGTQSERLKKVFPESGYSYREIGNKDGFETLVREMGRSDSHAYYIGKTYETGMRLEATEVLSMGVEFLYADPVTFAKTDPEFFDFIVGVLRGVL